jgi:hypothetical protein
MAKVQESVLVIRISKLVRDDMQDDMVTLPDGAVDALTTIAQELLGTDVIVEVAIA